jgi:hypothetical protein
MSWKDDLLPASFRGAEFFYRDVGREGGRRLANHEFPLRDDNFLEDMGKRAKVHRVQAYVLGNDYMAARDALEAALDEEGSGTFVHPFKGNLTVGCPSYSITERDEEGGIAFFEIVFVEAGSQPSPTSSTSTDDEAWEAGDDQMDLLGDDFASVYSLDGLPGFVRDVLAGNVFGLVADLASLAGLPGLPVGLLTEALAAISSAFDDPEALGHAVPDFFRAYAAGVVEILPVDDPHLSSRGSRRSPIPVTVWPLSRSGAKISLRRRARRRSGSSRRCQTALVALVQGSAVASLAQLYANTQFASAADAGMPPVSR